MSENKPTGDNSKAWRILFLLVGGGALFTFIILVAMGQGDTPPFAMAFLTAVLSGAIGNQAMSRGKVSVDWVAVNFSVGGPGRRHRCAGGGAADERSAPPSCEARDS